MCPPERSSSSRHSGPHRVGHITPAGTLHRQSPGWQADPHFRGEAACHCVVQRGSALWKSFRRSRTRFRGRPKTVRLHRGIGVRLHPGSCSGSSRNAGRHHPGMAFILPRIPQRSLWTRPPAAFLSMSTRANSPGRAPPRLLVEVSLIPRGHWIRFPLVR